ncbi:uncharacterized protein [Physcomitrium patens]|uniref:Histone-lysine N-methyltransferase n=1 Tax=Physcomitrium patens TaxID=3218 RepID=A0A2K1KES0_PHYPA|nr:uncharacterized protein LOC112283299 [Physcomitrium patens]XP_024377605.1 uncharacterized protein LOC112283299 [Physcomitrium patens]XP_024377606.1 uncharacterized protein LOC112283299 [Physcomitrium patens]PNR52272.1 hypothetical protein PHYPA_008646 [Physcomitrium patens]|eukprot:XP_024377604.1 uncharacterized protein LOC112283299 [Physcomitrella patens]
MNLPTDARRSQAMPALGHHENKFDVEGGLDVISMKEMDRNGKVATMEGRPGHDSFPIVYKRRFSNLDALMDPRPPRPPTILHDECRSADFAVVRRKASSPKQKQMTLEQFWGDQTSSKLLDRLPSVSNAGDQVPASVPSPVHHEDVDFERPASENNAVMKRKRVEKPLAIDLNSNPGSEKAQIMGRKQIGRPKGMRKVDQNLEGKLPRPASEVHNKKRRMGRPPKEGVKRERSEVKIRPGKRPKLVLGRNRKLEVEYHTDPKHELHRFTDVLQGSGTDERAHSAVRPHVQLVERSVVAVSCNEDGSSSGTQTEDDMPARIGNRQIRQRLEQEEVSSEATQSETATETDSDLPCLNGGNRPKRPDCEQGDEDDESDGDRIPIDLNVLPELLMSAKSRRKKRTQEQKKGTENCRKPALKRAEIHQQLRPLVQTKAVQSNQVVKSLWPLARGPQPHDSHESLSNENTTVVVTANPGKYISLKRLRSLAGSRKTNSQFELRESMRAVDRVVKVNNVKTVQPKAPRVPLVTRMAEPRSEKPGSSLSIHAEDNGVAGLRNREIIYCSSSEETESDREQIVNRFKAVPRFQGLVSQGQSPGFLYSGSALSGKASDLAQPRINGEDYSTANKEMPGKLYSKLTVNRTEINAGPQQNVGVSRKLSLVADLSDDSETESDKEIVGLGVRRPETSRPLLQASRIGMKQQNGERGKSCGLLKATFVRKPENAISGKCHVQSSPDTLRSGSNTPMRSPVSNVGSFLASKHPEGGLLSRNVVQRAKIIKPPQAKPAVNGIESNGAVTKFASQVSQKERKQKKIGVSILQGSETDGRRHSGRVEAFEAVSEAHCSGYYSSLQISPNNADGHQGAMHVSPQAELSVKLRTKKPIFQNGAVVVQTPVKLRTKKARIENEVIGMRGLAVSSKMTPRTRKLTDAMQKFVTQKANLRQWREVDLSKINPKALIGRTCKVFWPLDDEWYPGVIHDYNPQTKKHRIDYRDNEMEMVSVSKERFKLKLSPEEWVDLETATGEQPLIRSQPDPVELVALATAVEDQEKLVHGDLVWAKVKGWPMWPAFVMDEDHAAACGMDPGKKGMVPLQFFGSYDHCRFSYKKLVIFSKGLMMKFHTKCKRVVFVQGLEEVERYLKECKLPDSMSHLLDDGDGVHGAIERQRQEIEENWPEPEPDVQETGGEVKRMTRRRVKRVVTFPLQLGALTILSLGNVVRDSEHFHDQQYIWPEGYTSVRSFPSAKDPDAFVDYKMQVFRDPLTQSLPTFRCTPADDTPVEGPSPYACWKKAFHRLRKAHKKVGKIPELDKRMQFRSAAHMFGFSNPRVSKLIQALPGARACTKFANWSVNPPNEDVEAVLPAGYKPVEISWKHLDRCTVCYLDEEYVDNLLLQCDKCRIMVHMNCYGELELPDGDLWLCNLCRPDAPKTRPPCCLCPVTSGALKKTTDGRWAHLMCAMWIPETCLVDVKRMEPVDGINAISKERWRLTCSICNVPYGACIRCSVNSCKTAFHPLCARSAGLYMEVLEEKLQVNGETDLRLLSYCRKHKQSTRLNCEVALPTPCTKTDCLTYQPPVTSSGCARSEPYNAAARRGRREPEALAAALAKRLFVENLPYRVTGCRKNPLPKIASVSSNGNMWSMHWKPSKGPLGATALPASASAKSGEDVEILSMSDKFRRMKSSLSQRLAFGKSAIHGMGVFTKQVHYANDMIIEYAGEVVRPVIADIRERRCYDSLVGAGTYMFRIDDERVVDATHAGTIAHLINHSCEPNCYSRTVTASGEDRIIIFAKRNIEVGEELTYDYRFMSKDEVLTCYCGCAGCRGSVNVVDGDGDSTKLSVPLSELIKLPATTRGHTH